jgi:hypothetical protein
MPQEQKIVLDASKKSNPEFLSQLDGEKLKHKEHRHEYVKQKLLYVIGLFSLGSLNCDNV